MILQALQNLYFRDYEAEKREIDRDVVARFSRGNVLIQQGHYLDAVELRNLGESGDAALARISGCLAIDEPKRRTA